METKHQQTLLPSSRYGLTGNSATTFPYVYMDEDGTEHYFVKTDEGLIDEDGLGLELTVNTSNYVIKDKDDNTMTFNSSGLLTNSVKNNLTNSGILFFTNLGTIKLINLLMNLKHPLFYMMVLRCSRHESDVIAYQELHSQLLDSQKFLPILIDFY